MYPSAELYASDPGHENVALAPGPSVFPKAPVPAKVLTVPPEVIFLIALLPASVTKRLPDDPVIILVGWLKVAEVLKPLVNPGDPVPAQVLTAVPLISRIA